MRIALLFSLILFSVTITGCSTVNRGITDYFRIDSVPQGAKATTSIETSSSKAARRKNPKLAPVYHSCEPTPCAIPLYRRSEFVITLEQEGYETAEMFITNSSSAGSFTANMAATTATTTGAMAAGAAAGAAVASSLTAINTAIIGGTFGGTASIFTFGLIPVETGVSAGISLFSSSTPAVSSTAAASSAIPPALIVTGGMLVTDAVTGANVNLYPNPVVLKMAPKGTPIKTDPNVTVFKREASLKEQLEIKCGTPQRLRTNGALCADVSEQLIALRAEKKAAEKEAKKHIRAARKAAKEASRAQR